MADNKLPYVRFYMSDWLSATRGMKANEIGIYFTLLALMYERGEPLAENYDRLSRQCGCIPSVCEKVVNLLVEDGKIVRLEQGLWNKRVQKEFEFRQEKSRASSDAVSKRWNKPNEINDDDIRPNNERNTDVIPNPEARSQSKTKTNVFEKKGSLLSPDWKMETADLEFAKSAGFTEPEAQVIAQKFKAHFAALPDSKARRGDWSAAWESFVLNAPKRPIQTYAKQANTGYVPFVPAKATKPAEPLPAPVIHTEEEKARIRTLREMVRKGIPVQSTTATSEVLQ